ncbi:TPA: hypothetical protein N2B39_002395 [Pseudomonas aeruginosa]|nr:hypothetical protein [Pseudomonas aeruginosa]MDV6687947.1 hypothetical protein [Pseudomonas aeruginosa]HCL3865649.1 hypothetical protein [Pseudomonas aeruginosa]
MTLEKMPIKELLVLHNRIAEKPAGPKTFATRGKLIARIEQIMTARGIDLASFRQGTESEVTEQRTQPQVETTEAFDTAEKKLRGIGIGELARAILMDPVGFPHALVAEMVNAQIEGAAATAKSVRWYAHDMRKKGIEVPPRQKVHAAEMNEEESAEWLAAVTVVTAGEE